MIRALSFDQRRGCRPGLFPICGEESICAFTKTRKSASFSKGISKGSSKDPLRAFASSRESEPDTDPIPEEAEA